MENDQKYASNNELTTWQKAQGNWKLLPIQMSDHIFQL